MITLTISEYLIKRLSQLGVKHIFGVPSDYTLTFMTQIENSGIQLIGCCNELNAGYAADGYARINGIGVLCVSCFVGAFSSINAITGSHVEKIPLIVIVGNPTASSANNGILYHHVPQNRNMQKEVFQKIVKRVISISENQDNVGMIDEALQFCIQESEPILIELPSDLTELKCQCNDDIVFETEKYSAKNKKNKKNKKNNITSAVIDKLTSSKKPLIVAGIEISRLKLENEFLKLLQISRLNYVTTPLSKTIISEDHPQFCGVYWGKLSRLPVISYVEESDVILNLGVWKTDINLGFMTADFSNADMITIAHNQMIMDSNSVECSLKDFILQLTEELQNCKVLNRPAIKFSKETSFTGKNIPLTMDAFFSRMESFVENNKLIIADIGENVVGTMNMRLGKNTKMISQGLYQSIGYAVPATLGAGLADKYKRQMICFYGDGAFQLTGQEVSTIINQGCTPIMFLLNNKGYLVERIFLDGKYNNVANWKYHALPNVFGNCFTAEIFTEEELEKTLATLETLPPQPCFIEVHLPQFEHCEAMNRLAQTLKKDSPPKQ